MSILINSKNLNPIIQPANQGYFKITKLYGSSHLSQRSKVEWKYGQVQLYYLFLCKFRTTYPREQQLRWKDYVQMSLIIKTRNANQCRIFHSKFIKILGNLQHIYQFFREKIQPENPAIEEVIKRQDERQSQEEQSVQLQTNQHCLFLSSGKKQNKRAISEQHPIKEVKEVEDFWMYQNCHFLEQIQEQYLSLSNLRWLDEQIE